MPPSRVFFRLSEDLSPFMHELPRALGALDGLLKQLGCRETPLLPDYVHFLADLGRETQTRTDGQGHAEERVQPLNPNELKAVLSILGIVIQQTEDAEEEGQQGGREGLQGLLGRLYVPDEQSRMRPSSCCMVNDDPWLKSRCSGLSLCPGLFFLHPLMDARAAGEVLLVRRCSQVIEEVLLEPDPVRLSPLDDGVAEVERRLMEQLGNPHFLQVLSSLLLQHSKARGGDLTSSAAAAAPDLNLTGSARIVSHLSVRLVRNLRTEYRLRSGYVSAGQPLGSDGQLAESLFYLQRARGEGRSTLLINCSMVDLTSPSLSYEIAVSLGLCSFLQLDFALAASIACILRAAASSPAPAASAPVSGLVPVPVPVPMIAEMLRMRCDGAELKELLRGQPGEPLTYHDLQLLELKPFRVFRVGEIIAYFHKEGGRAEGAEGAGGWRYGRIVSVGPADGVSGVRQVFFRCDASAVSSLLSTEVHSFRSARTALESGFGPGPMAGAGAGAGAGAVVGVGAGAKKGEGDAAAGRRSSLLSFLPAKKGNKDGEMASLQQSSAVDTAASEAGGPDQRNLLEALNGLLVRVGVPVSLEQRVTISEPSVSLLYLKDLFGPSLLLGDDETRPGVGSQQSEDERGSQSREVTYPKID